MWRPPCSKNWFQHTAARRRLPEPGPIGFADKPVSTHSRPKAAAARGFRAAHQHHRFNTQPPEGGCMGRSVVMRLRHSFQHTAARRRLHPCKSPPSLRCCFNTQPPEGGCVLGGLFL